MKQPLVLRWFGKNRTILPVVLWYLLLSSHLFIALPVSGGEHQDTNRNRPVATTSSGAHPDSDRTVPSPHHASHSAAGAVLCLVCDMPAMTGDLPTLLLQPPLRWSIAANRIGTRFFGCLRPENDTVPDDPFPDPPLKIPNPLG